MRRIVLSLFLAANLFASVAFARQQRGEAAGSAPDVQRLREHVTYLASDKLEGRRTGTPGATLAAEYISKEFERLGLLRGGDDLHVSDPKQKTPVRLRRYLQSFPYVAGVEAGKGNAMLLVTRAAVDAANGTNARPVAASTLDLRLGEDWMPLGFSADGRVENTPLAFVGYGITAGELNHDDYAGADARGRIAVAFAGTPDGDNPHGRFARFGELRLKAAAARDHGAKALVVIAGEENFRDDKLSRLRHEDNGGEAGLPVVAVSRQAAAQMFGLNVAQLAALEKRTGGGTAAAPASTAVAGDASKNGGQDTNPHAALPTGAALTIATEVVRRTAPAFNVVGIIEGSDPQLKAQAIVVGAHYDHLGHGGQGSLAAREGEVHHGADDNASGTAALLELARIFSKERGKLRRSLVLVAFGGEEEGLLGSSFYVRHPAVPLAPKTVAMINMDMVGRLKENRLIVGGVGTAQEWRGWINDANTEPGIRMADASGGNHAARGDTKNGMPVVYGANGQVMANAFNTERFTLTLNKDGFGPSDHSSFYAQKTPVLFFWTGTHEDYHKPTDTAERINYEGEARIVAFVSRIVRAVATAPAPPTYAVAKSDAPQGRSTGFRVYLGTVPNYAEASDGLRLDAVRDDSPASKAGLKTGDRIVKLAGREVRNVYDYTYALSEMRAGQEYEVEIIRDGKPLQLKITPAARK